MTRSARQRGSVRISAKLKAVSAGFVQQSAAGRLTDMGRPSSLPSCSCCRNTCSWVAMSVPWCALSSPHCAAHARAIAEKCQMYRHWSGLDYMRTVVMRFCSADLTKPRAGDCFQRFPQPVQPMLRAFGHLPALTRTSYRASFAPDATRVCTHSWHAVQKSTSWYLGCCVCS